jgi:alpha-1,3-mannosyltransferase
VVTTHGGIFHTPAWGGLKKLYWRNILPRSLSAASKVVAVSERDASMFATIVPADKLVTIPNGIDFAFANARAERARGRLVCIGRVSGAKGIDQVIRLLALIARDLPEAELLVAGPDEDGASETLRRQSDALHLKGRVKFLGALPMDELAALAASAHLYVSAAQHEGFGITTVEALSAGTPVLVTRTGVHEQIVKPGVNGWFWSGHADAEAAATLREALLLADARLDDMRAAARASAAPFDWDVSTDKYERVLESAYRENLR